MAAALESHDYFLNTIEVRSRRLEHSSRSHVLSNCMCVACNHAMAGESTCGAVHRGYVAELCAQAHAELLHRGRVAAAAALSAAEGSGSRRSAVYVGFPLCACALCGRCEVRFFKETGQSNSQKPKNFPVGSQSSRRLAALGAPMALRLWSNLIFSHTGSKCYTLSDFDPPPKTEVTMRFPVKKYP